MHSIKKSSSGFQIIGGKIGISSVAYNKSMQKIYQLEFELERQKETMVKLQLELIIQYQIFQNCKMILSQIVIN